MSVTGSWWLGGEVKEGRAEEEEARLEQGASIRLTLERLEASFKKWTKPA